MHHTGEHILSSDTVQYLDKLRNDWDIKGVAISVVKMNRTTGKWETETLGFGEKDVDGNPVNDKTLFCMASNSKLFTVFAIGLALHQKGLSWKSKVKDVIPDFQCMDKEADERTSFEELFSHTTGMPRHDISYDNNTTTKNMVKTFRYLKPSAPFKTTWQYCNITYAIATEVPDQLLGTPFCTYVQDNIWTPLGMNDTYCDHRVARATGDLVSGFGRKLQNDQLTFKDVEAVRHSIRKGDGKLDAKCRGEEMDLGWFQKDWEMFIGVGGIITCAKDMIIWLQTLLLEGSNPKNGQSVIPSWIVQDAMQPQITCPNIDLGPEIGSSTYGFAQEMYKYRDHDVVEHTGDVGGQKTVIIRIPEKMIGTMVFCNDNDLGIAYHDVAKFRILDDLLGLEPVDFKTRLLDNLLDAKKADEPQRPEQPVPPTGGFISIAGKYFNQAFGTFELCPVLSTFTETDQKAMKDAGLPDSRSRFQTDDLGTITEPSFVVRTYKEWTKRLVFSHHDNETFKVMTRNIYPDTGAMTWSVRGYQPCIQARCGEGGMGLIHMWRGVGVPDGDMDEGGIKDGAEVFFTKI